MKNLIKSVVLAAVLAVIGPILGGTAYAWSIREAHEQANSTLVEVGDWCSGTIVNKERGFVITAAHCTIPVAHRKHVKVTRPDGKQFHYNWTVYDQFYATQRALDSRGTEIGRIKYLVEVAAVEPDSDVAVLKNISGVPFHGQAKMSAVPVEFGDVVYAVGNPLLIPGVATSGHVVHPKVVLPPLGPVVTIMHTAPIDGGSSGGGLYNDSGELVGLTNWGKPGGYEGFASPISNAIKLLATLDAPSPKTDKLASAQ